MYSLLRPVLFAMSPEQSHGFTMVALRALGSLPGNISPAGGTSRKVMGMEFANPIGLAAGLDKDGTAVEGLAKLGFGFVEVGTVTPKPQPGNPQPRLFRIGAQQALINRMGFNNLGVEELIRNLSAVRERDRMQHTRLGINVGKNKDTPLQDASRDYVHSIERVYALADYITVNLSSPNTPGLRSLQQGDSLRRLLGDVKACQLRCEAKSSRYVPLIVKFSPDMMSSELLTAADLINEFAIDGVIATNTTLARPNNIEQLKHGQEAGGLSGRPLQSAAIDTVAQLRSRLADQLPIIGCGGIDTPAQAKTMFNAGANLLQLYTGLIYRGPGLVRKLARL